MPKKVVASPQVATGAPEMDRWSLSVQLLVHVVAVLVAMVS